MGNKDIKIDIVIPWVDGSDPQWLKEKNKYDVNTSQDGREIRFRDNGFLKYWFRGIELYAPWVNKIHFITWGHIPEWLNVNHPKLNIVRHQDYIPSKYLPTFSSHVIELNMHRIKGLSEYFIYFNDDMYIIDSVSKQDFFDNNLPCDCLVLSAITPRIGEFSSILCRTTGVINNHFKKEDIKKLGLNKNFSFKYKELLIRTLTILPYHHIMGFYNPHICQAFRKATFYEVWDLENDELEKTSKNKFRGDNDVSQYLFRYWHLCKGEFVPKYPIGKMMNVRDHTDLICKCIENHKYKTLTINDASHIDNLDIKLNKINKSFEKIFPNKSEYEL